MAEAVPNSGKELVSLDTASQKSVGLVEAVGLGRSRLPLMFQRPLLVSTGHTGGGGTIEGTKTP